MVSFWKRWKNNNSEEASFYSANVPTYYAPSPPYCSSPTATNINTNSTRTSIGGTINMKHRHPESILLRNHDDDDRNNNNNNSSGNDTFSYSEHRITEVQRRMKVLSSLAAIGGFLFGYDTGVISGAMPPISRAFQLNTTSKAWVVSSTVLSAFLSSMMGGTINDRYGRKKTIIMASLVFTMGGLLMGMAWNYVVLLIGRLTIGIGIGLSSLTSPMYIAEVAAPSMRGTLVTINLFMVCFGQFFAGMLDGILDQIDPDDGWRFMLGIAALPSIIMFIGFQYLPESPRWLVMNDRSEEALVVLKSVRNTDEAAEEELKEIQYIVEVMNALGRDENEHHYENEGMELSCLSPVMSVEHNDDDDDDDEMNKPTSFKTHTPYRKALSRMMAHNPTRRALGLGCGMMLLQQFSGINTVMYFAASIYEMSGFAENTAVWLSGFTALAQVTGVVFSIYLIERIGRRPLLLTSLFFVTLALFGLGASFYWTRLNSGYINNVGYDPDNPCSFQPAIVWSGTTAFCYDCTMIAGCGYCNGVCTEGDEDGPFDNNQCDEDATWEYDICLDSHRYGYMSVFFMVAYLLAFGIGMGPLPWTVCSEIYPLEYRSQAVGLSTATNWITNFIVSATFLSLSDASILTRYGAFWLYASIALVGLGWLFVVLPETKGLSLEEIEEIFRRPGDHEGQTGLSKKQKELLSKVQVNAAGH